MGRRLVLQAQLEPRLPKLLVKVNPQDGRGFLVRNPTEALVVKSSVQAGGRVAVVHMSRSVPVGVLVMSLWLSEVLDVEDGESLELQVAASVTTKVNDEETQGQEESLPCNRTAPSPTFMAKQLMAKQVEETNEVNSHSVEKPLANTKAEREHEKQDEPCQTENINSVGPHENEQEEENFNTNSEGKSAPVPGPRRGIDGSLDDLRGWLRNYRKNAQRARTAGGCRVSRGYHHTMRCEPGAGDEGLQSKPEPWQSAVFELKRTVSDLDGDEIVPNDDQGERQETEDDQDENERSDSPYPRESEEGAQPLHSVEPMLPISRRERCNSLELMPLQSDQGGATPSGSSRKLRTARKGSTLGELQTEILDSAALVPGLQDGAPRNWRSPTDLCGDRLERTELGPGATADVRRWLAGGVSGRLCAQVMLDHAVTSPANFKLSGGLQLQMLGGPLGAMVGGFSNAVWLQKELFTSPAEAIPEAFRILGFKDTQCNGDWSRISVEEISLAFRRLCLKTHPNRGGSEHEYVRVQVAMELVRAFCGEAGPIDGEIASEANEFILTDLEVDAELRREPEEAERLSIEEDAAQLAARNRAFDEYILRQMCFKREIVDEVARLHENCAYAMLGVSADASDSEIRKAYRKIAMEVHPDKGGEKEEFQELVEAYEKIMEQRRSSNPCQADDEGSNDEGMGAPGRRSSSEGTGQEKGAGEDAGADNSSEDEGAEKSEKAETAQGSGEAAILAEKAERAAAEASKFASTAAGFAQRSAEAAEAAVAARDAGGQDVRAVAHRAIVLALTAVKAVRTVGYAVLEAATQGQTAAKETSMQGLKGMADRAGAAMSLGFEALNAALACAEATKSAAAELQRDTESDEGSAEAAQKASSAAAKAAAAAEAAAKSAQVVSADCKAAAEGAAKDDNEKDADKEKGEDQEKEEKEKENEEEEAEKEDEEQEEPVEEELPEEPPQPPTKEQLEERARRRRVCQRLENHAVLRRLNAEIKGYQRSIHQFLQKNRVLLPEVTRNVKRHVFEIVIDVLAETREAALNGEQKPHEAREIKELLVPLVKAKEIAVRIAIPDRILRLAALYDLNLTRQLVEEHLFQPLLTKAVSDEHSHVELERLRTHVLDALEKVVNDVEEQVGR